jgi:hypothetical protein
MVGTPLLDPLESGNALIKRQLAVEGRSLPMHLEEAPALLWQAVTLAHSLVSQLKPFNDSQLTRLNL